MTARKVIGVDSSTQSCKVVLCDADTGKVLAQGRADHPAGTEVDPQAWWAAFERASDGLLGQADAISIAGQQHGMVAIDEAGAVVRKALLWNDLRSAPDADDLVAELGSRAWARATGSVPGASFTISKLRWLARCEPDNAARTAAVLLPHDWLTSRLVGTGTGTGAAHGAAKITGFVTDAGDASGTGYFSPADRAYLPDFVECGLGHRPVLPRIAAPAECVGTTASGAAIGPGTGDNMGAALGLGAEPGDAIVSLGTSGTVFGVADRPTADPTGAVAGFADATGRFLPLICTLNAARGARRGRQHARSRPRRAGFPCAASRTRRRRHRPAALPGWGTDTESAGRRRVAARPHPRQHDAGQRRQSRRRGHVVRSGRRRRCADGGAADRAEQAAADRRGSRIARGPRRVACPVRRPRSATGGRRIRVALGAARQAAWVQACDASSGLPPVLPPWTVPAAELEDPSDTEVAAGAAVRQRYAEIRLATHGV